MSYCEDNTVVVPEVLKWSSLGLLVICGRVLVVDEATAPANKKQRWTLLHLTHLIVVLGSAILAALNGYMIIGEHWTAEFLPMPTFRKSLADFAMGVSLLAIFSISWSRVSRSLGASGFLCGLFGILTTAMVTDVVILNQRVTEKDNIIYSDTNIRKDGIIISVTLAVFLALSFVNAGLLDRVFSKTSPMKTKGASSFKDETDMSPYGRLISIVLRPILNASWMSREMTDDDLPKLRRVHRCRNLMETFTVSIADRGAPETRAKFTLRLFQALRMDLLYLTICTLSYYATLLTRVPALEWLINSCGTNELQSSALLFAVTSAADLIISVYHMELMCELGCRVRAMLQGSIFKKMTLLSPTSLMDNTPGFVMSILGVDSSQIALAAYGFPLPVGGVMCLPIILVLLAQRAGTGPVLCCVAYMAFLAILPIPLSRLQNMFWRRQMKARDERIKRTDDLFSSVRLVKMYAWEDAYLENVQRARDVEMTPLFCANVLDGFIDSLYSASSSVLTIILFGTMPIFHPERVLTPAVSFVCIYLIYMTDLITASTAQVLRYRTLVLFLKTIS